MLKSPANGIINRHIKVPRCQAANLPGLYTDKAVQRMTKYIPLTRGYVALVDEVDYSELSRHKWCLMNSGSNLYAHRYDSELGYVTMHRAVMGLKKGDGQRVDHINGDTFDCRRSNLRLCNVAQNGANSGIQSRNTSGFKGVSWSSVVRKWHARICHKNKKISIGYFTSKIEAVIAYDLEALHLKGEFAWTNLPHEVVAELLRSCDEG